MLLRYAWLISSGKLYARERCVNATTTSVADVLSLTDAKVITAPGRADAAEGLESYGHLYLQAVGV